MLSYLHCGVARYRIADPVVGWAVRRRGGCVLRL